MYNMFLGLGLYYADPVRHVTTAREDLDDLDHDLSDLSEVWVFLLALPDWLVAWLIDY